MSKYKYINGHWINTENNLNVDEAILKNSNGTYTQLHSNGLAELYNPKTQDYSHIVLHTGDSGAFYGMKQGMLYDAKSKQWVKDTGQTASLRLKLGNALSKKNLQEINAITNLERLNKLNRAWGNINLKQSRTQAQLKATQERAKNVVQVANHLQKAPIILTGAGLGVASAGVLPTILSYTAPMATEYGADKLAGNHEGTINVTGSDGKKYQIQGIIDKEGKYIGNYEGAKLKDGVTIISVDGEKSDTIFNNKWARGAVDAAAATIGGGIGNAGEYINLFKGLKQGFLSNPSSISSVISSNSLSLGQLATLSATKELGKQIRNLYLGNLGAFEGFNLGETIAPDNKFIQGAVGTLAGLATGKMLKPGGINQLRNDIILDVHPTWNKYRLIKPTLLATEASGKAAIGGGIYYLLGNTNEYINQNHPQEAKWINPVLLMLTMKALGNISDRLSRGFNNATMLGIMQTGNSQQGIKPMTNAIESLTGVKLGDSKKQYIKDITSAFNPFNPKLTENGKTTVRAFIEPLSPFKSGEEISPEHYVSLYLENMNPETSTASKDVRNRGAYIGLVVNRGINGMNGHDFGVPFKNLTTLMVMESPIALMILGKSPTKGVATQSGRWFTSEETKEFLNGEIIQSRIPYFRTEYADKFPEGTLPDIVLTEHSSQDPKYQELEGSWYSVKNPRKYNNNPDEFYAAREQYRLKRLLELDFTKQVLAQGKIVGQISSKNEFSTRSQYRNNTTGNIAYVVEMPNGKHYVIHTDIFKIKSTDFNTSHSDTSTKELSESKSLKDRVKGTIKKGLQSTATEFAEYQGRPTLHVTVPKELTPQEFKNLQIHSATKSGEGRNSEFALLLKVRLGSSKGDITSFTELTRLYKSPYSDAEGNSREHISEEDLRGLLSNKGTVRSLLRNQEKIRSSVEEARTAALRKVKSEEERKTINTLFDKRLNNLSEIIRIGKEIDPTHYSYNYTASEGWQPFKHKILFGNNGELKKTFSKDDVSKIVKWSKRKPLSKEIWEDLTPRALKLLETAGIRHLKQGGSIKEIVEEVNTKQKFKNGDSFTQFALKENIL